MQARALMTLAGLALLGSPAAQASFYPPDYVISESCLEQGPVSLCAVNHRYGNYPRLRVTYRGSLLERSWGRIDVHVQLNGRAHTFRMRNFNYQETITLGGPAGVRMCKAGIPGPNEEDLPPYNRTCLHTTEPAGAVVWEADPIPQDQAELFFYTYDGHSPNAWDVELAFVSESGEWDSLFGSNYRFRFE